MLTIVRRSASGACFVLLSFFLTAATARAESLDQALRAAAPELSGAALDAALDALDCSRASNDIKTVTRLAVIDYSLPSTQARLWVFDLQERRLLFRELVAHGRNSGDNYTRFFSNAEGSRQTSLGLFRTESTYDGNNGYSMRLTGLEPGFNDQAMARAIVMHGAPYVDATLAAKQGRIGRSWGCPAVRAGIARTMIDTLKNGQLLFAYYPDSQWLSRSRYLNCAAASRSSTRMALANNDAASGGASSQ